jgi:hypothetical protein
MKKPLKIIARSSSIFPINLGGLCHLGFELNDPTDARG